MVPTYACSSDMTSRDGGNRANGVPNGHGPCSELRTAPFASPSNIHSRAIGGLNICTRIEHCFAYRLTSIFVNYLNVCMSHRQRFPLPCVISPSAIHHKSNRMPKQPHFLSRQFLCTQTNDTKQPNTRNTSNTSRRSNDANNNVEHHRNTQYANRNGCMKFCIHCMETVTHIM